MLSQDDDRAVTQADLLYSIHDWMVGLKVCFLVGRGSIS